MSAVERALSIQERGEFDMPERLNMGCGGEGNILLLMPCKTDTGLATKLVTVFPDNRERGLPAIDGLVVLNDPSSGKILALMDAKSLTAVRTGAVTGVSVRHLAARDVECVGLVGCGVQGYDQVRHACAARPIRRVLLHSRSARSRDALQAKLALELPEVEVLAATSIEALMESCQVLITATSSREPVLPDEPSLYEGKHCVAIGSFEPSVREYPGAIFERTARVWVDTPHALEESGELAIPVASGLIGRDCIQTLGAHIAGEKEPERGPHGTTFFKSVGMALFDLQAAQAVYQQALQRGLGVELES